MANAIGRRALLEGSGAAAGLVGIGAVPRFAQAIPQPQLPTAAELRAAVKAKQAINRSFLPTGSDALKTWVQQLANELTAAGVQNVATPPFQFTQWTVKETSLLLKEGNNAGPVKITSYFPYSTPTTDDGVIAPLTYLSGVSGFFGPPPSGQQVTLVNPSFLGQPLNLSVNGQTLEAALSALDVIGKIVVFDLPIPPVPLTSVLAEAFY